MEGTRKLLVDKVSEFANLGGGGGDLLPKKESIADFFQKILEYLLHIFDPVWGFFVQIFNSISWASLVEKFDSIWGFLVEKLSLILPDSETLHHWLHVGLTLVLPIALLLLFLYYCGGCFFRGCCGCFHGFFRLCCGCFHGFFRGCWGCFRGFFRGCWGCFRGCWGCFRSCCRCCGMVGRGTGKMMKAPGQMGVTILRASFEANPLGYFRALHAGVPLLS